MGSCASSLDTAKGLTEDLLGKLEAVERILASPLVEDLEDAFQLILSLNLSESRAAGSKQERKRVLSATARVLQMKADHELLPAAPHEADGD